MSDPLADFTGDELSAERLQPVVDGGRVTAPRLAFWNPESGAWEVENRGVSPDIEVEFDPEAVRQGRDPQL